MCTGTTSCTRFKLLYKKPPHKCPSSRTEHGYERHTWINRGPPLPLHLLALFHSLSTLLSLRDCIRLTCEDLCPAAEYAKELGTVTEHKTHNPYGSVRTNIHRDTHAHTGGVELHTHSASRGYPTHSANPDREGLIPKVVVSTGTHFLFPSPCSLTHSTAASSTCVHPVDLHIQHTSRTQQRSPG